MTGGNDIVMFLANGFASDPRVEKEAVALIAAGHSVTVLAWDREGSLPVTEERSGIRIERFGPPSGHGRGARSIPGFLRFWRSAARRAATLAPSVLHCHDLDTAIAGLLARRRLARVRDLGGIPRLVLDFHELYRQSNMIPRGVAGRLVGAVAALVERVAIPRSDAVLVANPGSMSAYRRYERDCEFHIIENAPEKTRFVPHGPRRTQPDEPLTIGYMGQKRDATSLLNLIGVTRGDARLRAILAGGGVGAAEVEAAASGCARLEVSGRFVYDDLPELYKRCDVIYAVYDASLLNWRTAFPVKVMEAMACALPVIVAQGTWVADYVREHGIGLAVDPGPGPLHTALATLLEDPAAAREMGTRGRERIDAGLNWEAVADRLVGVYRGLLGE